MTANAWVPLFAQEDTELPRLLQQNGIASDDALLRRIWLDDRNSGFQQARPRPPYRVLSGDTVRVPPPPLPPDATLGTYTCTGSEPSVDEVVRTIRINNGEGSLNQLMVADGEFTREYLLGLVYNQTFRLRHTGDRPVPIGPGEEVRFPIRPRRTRAHDVTPATASQPGARNEVPTGEGAFQVAVTLAAGPQILKFVDEATRQWRVQPVRFAIRITPRQAGVTPARVALRVLKEDGSTYFNQEHTSGEWLRAGEHVWAWDGFTEPPSGPGAADRGRLDTQVLRSRLRVVVLVEAQVGAAGRGELQLDNRAHKCEMVDVVVDLATREITGTAWVSFNHAGRDGGMWLGTLLAIAAATAAILVAELAVLGAYAGIKEVADDSWSEGERDRWKWAFAITAMAAPVVLALVAGILMQTQAVSDEEFEFLRTNLKDGINSEWGRADRQVTIAGQTYQFRAQAVDRSHDTVRFALMKPLSEGQRACNLSLVLGFLPILVPYSSDVPHLHHVGAHEFGHTILGAAVDRSYSITHKGSSGGVTDQNPLPTSHAEAGPGDLDMMKYYCEQREPGFDWNRLKVTEQDKVRWMEVAQVEFREM
jgi:hypothetical protein